MNGAVLTVKGDRWTEPPVSPESDESLFIVVYQGNVKVAAVNPVEVILIHAEGAVEE